MRLCSLWNTSEITFDGEFRRSLTELRRLKNRRKRAIDGTAEFAKIVWKNTAQLISTTIGRRSTKSRKNNSKLHPSLNNFYQNCVPPEPSTTFTTHL